MPGHDSSGGAPPAAAGATSTCTTCYLNLLYCTLAA
jgi:hypothetical protein